MAVAYVESPYLEELRQKGRDFRFKPAEGVVVTGYAGISPLGDTQQTWDGFKEGRSAVVTLDTGNQYCQLAAPLRDDYDPVVSLPPAGRKRMTRPRAMAIATSQEADRKARLLDENGRLRTDLIPAHKAGTWTSSGIAETPLLWMVLLRR